MNNESKEEFQDKVKSLSMAMYDEATEAARSILGSLPSMPEGLDYKQQIFLSTYFVELTNIPAALKAAKVSLRTYRGWMKENANFLEGFNDANFLIKSCIHSVILKDVIYKRDTKLMTKILESFFPETYGANPVIVEEDETEVVSDMVASLMDKTK